MSVLIRPLNIVCDESIRDDQRDSFEENQMHDTVEEWLQRTLLLPPLSTWQTGGGK